MSNRSLFPEGVEVHQRALEYEAQQRVLAENTTFIRLSSRGVVSGLNVSASNLNVSIVSGNGITPNGKLVNNAQTVSVPLADYTNGVKNYVLLMYDETQTLPESHETDGTTRFTRALESSRIVVLTEAQYNALPLDNPVLGTNDKNRALILAIVTARGAGINLVAGDIQSPSALSVPQSINQPVTITGVTIVSSLNFTQASLVYVNSPSKTLAWAGGTPVTITSSGLYTLNNIDASRNIVVNVTFSLLPGTNVTETITSTDIYTQTIPRNTGIDRHHRSLVGSGVVTTKNPHGMTLADIGGDLNAPTEQHQDIMHANGIVVGSPASTLAATVNTATAPDQLTITNFAAGATAYIAGKRITTINGSNIVTFADVVSTFPNLYEVWMNSSGQLVRNLRVSFQDSDLDAHVKILKVVGLSPGEYTLSCSDSGGLLLAEAATGLDGAYISQPPIRTGTAVRVYNLGMDGYLECIVNIDSLPASTTTSTFDVYASPDANLNMPICSVLFSGTSTGYLGAGFDSNNGPNFVSDMRIWGNIDRTNVRVDSGLQGVSGLAEIFGAVHLVRTQLKGDSATNSNELKPVDVADLEFRAYQIPSPGNIYVSGGLALIDGKVFEVKSALLNVNPGGLDPGIYLVYVDWDGVLRSCLDDPAAEPNHPKNVAVGRQYLPIAILQWEGGFLSSTIPLVKRISLSPNVPLGPLILNSSGSFDLDVNAPVRLFGNVSLLDMNSATSFDNILRVTGATAGSVIFAQNTSSSGDGIRVNSTGSTAVGVRSTSAGASAVKAEANGATTIGVDVDTTTGTGITVNTTTGDGITVSTTSASPGAVGITVNTVGDTGIWTTSTNSYGLDARAGGALPAITATNSGTGLGIVGKGASTSPGVVGMASSASVVPGVSNAGVVGVTNTASGVAYGVFGDHTGATTTGAGVYGRSINATGVSGESTAAIGVQGVSTSNYGVRSFSVNNTSLYVGGGLNFGIETEKPIRFTSNSGLSGKPAFSLSMGNCIIASGRAKMESGYVREVSGYNVGAIGVIGAGNAIFDIELTYDGADILPSVRYAIAGFDTTWGVSTNLTNLARIETLIGNYGGYTNALRISFWNSSNGLCTFGATSTFGVSFLVLGLPA